MVVIPVESSPPFVETVSLDGTDYVLDFRFNSREQTWNVSIMLPDGTMLAPGIKLVCNYPLLQKYADPRVPNGELFCVTQTNDDSPPGMNDLATGGRCALCYASVSELSPGEPWRL